MKIEKMTLGSLGTNSYIVYDEETKEAVLFDPADNAPALLDKLHRLEVCLKYIVITHAHCDHIAALDKVKLETGAKICIGKDDSAALNDAGLSLCIYFRQNAPQCKADIEINDGDAINVGNTKMEFIHTPGHTRGGICTIFDNVLISGDTLFFESVGRSDFPGGSTSTLLNSIKEKLFVLPDDTKVYPGHGDATTIGHEKKNNPFIW